MSDDEVKRNKRLNIIIAESLIKRDLQGRKLFESCYLTEKALIERMNGTLKPSSYTLKQKNNIEHLLSLFRGTVIFKGLPYEMNVGESVSLFD